MGAIGGMDDDPAPPADKPDYGVAGQRVATTGEMNEGIVQALGCSPRPETRLLGVSLGTGAMDSSSSLGWSMV